MLTVNKLIAQARGLAPALLRRAAAVVLDWDTRQKSRFDAEDSQGRSLGVFLPRGSVVRGGDVLVAEDGSLVRVIATPQPVMVVRCAEHGSPFDLVRAAYHLGNRHVALELQADRLQLEPDHVLADMLRQMHLSVSEELAPFEPEGGAYAAHAEHAHEPAGPTQERMPERAARRPPDDRGAHIAGATAPAAPAHQAHRDGHGHDHRHVHGPDCGHDHP